MTRGALLTLSLMVSASAHAQNMSFEDILALDESTAPGQAALTRAPSQSTSIEPITPGAGPTLKWGYDGESGPQHWHTLHSDYASCAGENQSPIDIQSTFDTELAPIAFHYDESTQSVSNNGNAVQFTYPTGKHIVVDGKTFYLRHLDIHTPSEHRINGEPYPLEAQLTHESLDGEIAVIAVMATEADNNRAVDALLQAIPANAGQTAELARFVEPSMLLPERLDYYRFNGSLTTPPCTEGVRWFVFKDTLPLSASQIATVSSALAQANNRPVQALNARLVLE